jgi:formylglycine-generating enzyme required for sulfatase activity
MANNVTTLRPDLQINSMTNRQAMGLSDNYSAMRFDNNEDLINKYRFYDKHQLVNIIQQANVDIAQRYACGQLLALIGDPRINTFAPTMQEIPTAMVNIGLETSRVASIVDRYKNVGVLKEWIDKETPKFAVKINRFNMAVYPVTNYEYRQYLCSVDNGEIPTSWHFGRYPNHLANHPVATISDLAAAEYAKWLSHSTGRAFRLPSEIEWEYAAAGLNSLEFPWGNNYQINYANTAEFGLFSTSPVGIFVEGASPFGLLDMAGNVEEYTSSNYWVYPGGKTIEDDLLMTSQNYKVARGGSYTRFSDLARCSRRHGRYAKEIYVMGFRLAETLE